MNLVRLLNAAIRREDYDEAKKISEQIKVSRSIGMKKLSKRDDLLESLQHVQDIDQIISMILENSKGKVIDDATHDYILTEKLFPMLGEEFKKSPDIPPEKFEEFKKQFAFKEFGIEEKAFEKIQKQIDKGKNIDRVIDTIVKYIPEEKKDEIVSSYIKEKYFVQNCKGDLPTFIKSLKPEFWFMEE